MVDVNIFKNKYIKNKHKIRLLIELKNETFNMRISNKLQHLKLNNSVYNYKYSKKNYEYYNTLELIKIPIKVFTLYNLKYLNISYINLKYLPPELSLLKNLEILVCKQCNLKSISNIKNKLKILDVSYNYIKRITNLPITLEKINISWNRLKKIK